MLQYIIVICVILILFVGEYMTTNSAIGILPRGVAFHENPERK
ncbi:hypothetical protein OROMI_003792 [Orobanche minor]